MIECGVYSESHIQQLDDDKLEYRPRAVEYLLQLYGMHVEGGLLEYIHVNPL